MSGAGLAVKHELACQVSYFVGSALSRSKHLPHPDLAGPADRIDGDQGLDDLPLVVGQVGRVGSTLLGNPAAVGEPVPGRSLTAAGASDRSSGRRQRWLDGEWLPDHFVHDGLQRGTRFSVQVIPD